MTAMIVLDSGMAIVKKKRKSLQPSICAASSSSCGSELSKKERQTIRLYTLTAAGSTSAQAVL